ncbi:MAG: ribonuclease D [Candidatus Melainabacteria bacterium]|nr:ribonuclease D [Candidatus Melainabacteria bacterium]
MAEREQENVSNTRRDNLKINLENVQLVKNDLSDELLEYYLKCDLLAVDCEMMGLNPFRDRLCLIQICDATEKATLVKLQDCSKAPSLKKLFENPNVRKIFHFARTDLAFLYYHLQIDLVNVFCTKSASKLVRTYTDKQGLKDLLKELLKIDIDKNTQQTDWGAPELTKDQIKYAACDVLFLIPAYNKLIDLLQREGRLELMEEVNKFLPTLAKLDLLGYVDFFVH